jgi:Mor family transcriptional regulator
VYKEIAVLIGLDNAHKIYEYFSGQQITFPVKWLKKEYVAEMVLKRYDGRNLKYLAKEYNYSERWLRQIIKNHENDTEETADEE